MDRLRVSLVERLASAKVPHGAFCMTTDQARDEIAGGGRLIVLRTELLFMTNKAKEETGESLSTKSGQAFESLGMMAARDGV